VLPEMLALVCRALSSADMREDAAQSYKDQGPHNLSLLRRMALQMLKSDTSVKIGVQAKRKRAGWNLGYLELLLGITI